MNDPTPETPDTERDMLLILAHELYRQLGAAPVQHGCERPLDDELAQRLRELEE